MGRCVQSFPCPVLRESWDGKSLVASCELIDVESRARARESVLLCNCIGTKSEPDMTRGVSNSDKDMSGKNE